MNTRRIAGLVLVVVGVGLFIVGLNASDSFADRMSNFFTGQYTDSTVWYMMVGVAAVVGGLLLASVGGRMRST